MLIAALLFIAQHNLDAPIDTKPTVRSEIHRGAAAALDCQFGNEGDALRFSLCVDRVSSANEQKMSQGYDAFDVGLFCSAVDYAQITADVTHDPGAVNQVASLRKVCVNLRGKLHLTEADVTAAIRR